VPVGDELGLEVELLEVELELVVEVLLTTGGQYPAPVPQNP
jgi:hypothetical protein